MLQGVGAGWDALPTAVVEPRLRLRLQSDAGAACMASLNGDSAGQTTALQQQLRDGSRARASGARLTIGT